LGVLTLNKEKPIRDQAERLRKRVERKTEHAVEKREALPPRSELHRQKQKKTKVKVKYPVIRLMALFFILLPITIFSIISYLEGGKGPIDFTSDRAGVELIDVADAGEEKAGDSNADDEDAPAIEEITDESDIDVAVAAPAPESRDEKNSSDFKAEDQQNSGPAAAGTAKEKAQETPETTAPPVDNNPVGQEKIIYHTVQPSETLFRVAMKYYKSQDGIPIIKSANNIQGNEIQAGQILKIPIKN
jgi:LysM repeat protein